MRTLTATTCLTAASAGVAAANTIIEGTPPAPANFGNASPGYVMNPGVDQVQGVFTPGTDPTDFFEFTGLLPGSPYTITTTVANGSLAGTVEALQSDGVTVLNGPTAFNGSPIIFTGSVPGDEKIVIDMVATEGTTSGYTVNMSAQLATPEPSTLAGVGLALAGALARRRRKQ